MQRQVAQLAVETPLSRLVEGEQRPVQRMQALPELVVRDTSHRVVASSVG